MAHELRGTGVGRTLNAAKKDAKQQIESVLEYQIAYSVIQWGQAELDQEYEQTYAGTIDPTSLLVHQHFAYPLD